MKVEDTYIACQSQLHIAHSCPSWSPPSPALFLAACWDGRSRFGLSLALSKRKKNEEKKLSH
eukprot:scaffold225436_cov18-Tisochrysis_lutea.AAC.1